MSTLVITGAGISIESGIKPFRGPDGNWEENPITMATVKKYYEDPEYFLQWYYNRFNTALNAKPNIVHKTLAKLKLRVITQNVDNLHVKARHPKSKLIEIHGNLMFKRRMNSDCIGQLRPAEWEKVIDPKKDLQVLFNLSLDGKITQKSYRPHVLLFDEYYTELYHYKKALDWVNEADTVIFMGTSNSVGFTETVLDISVNEGKKVIVVDPSPSPSFFKKGVEFEMISASEYVSKIIVD